MIHFSALIHHSYSTSRSNKHLFAFIMTISQCLVTTGSTSFRYASVTHHQQYLHRSVDTNRPVTRGVESYSEQFNGTALSTHSGFENSAINETITITIITTIIISRRRLFLVTVLRRALSRIELYYMTPEKSSCYSVIDDVKSTRSFIFIFLVFPLT